MKRDLLVAAIIIFTLVGSAKSVQKRLAEQVIITCSRQVTLLSFINTPVDKTHPMTFDGHENVPLIAFANGEFVFFSEAGVTIPSLGHSIDARLEQKNTNPAAFG
jgi:hypothetical protein